MRRLALAVLTSALLVALSGTGHASWGASGTGSGLSRAQSMPSGSQPTASASGRSVTVSWAASRFAGGEVVNGYAVRRYDEAGASHAIGTGCDGVVAATSCVERAVPPGTWRYAVTPRQGSWAGTESVKSSGTVLDAPTLSLSPSLLTLTSLPSTVSGTIASFIGGETLRFHLDSATGPELSGRVAGAPTPAAVPPGGAASVEVTIPAGVSDGPHNVFAVASPSGEADSDPFTVRGGPQLRSLEMFDANVNGRVDRVVATFSENVSCVAPCTSPWTLSAVPSGGMLSSASVSGSAATLTLLEGSGARDTGVGSFTVALAANAGGVRDADGNPASFAATSPMDRAAPVPVSLAETNGTTDGKMEARDTLTVTFSEALAASSVPTAPTVTEADPSGSGNDTLAITGITNGALNTGSNAYIKNNTTSNSYAPSSATLGPDGRALTVTVDGSCSPATGANACSTNVTAGGPGTLLFAPSPTLTDAVGNAAGGSLSASLRLF